MRTLQRGFKQRFPRTFFQDNVAADLDALVVSIRDEAGNYLETSAEGTFNELDIKANKTSTGSYYIDITPDADEAIGIWIVYWRYTYGTGDAAETAVAEEVMQLVGEDSVPILVDNYMSLDVLAKTYQTIFSMKTADELYRVGFQASRVFDSELDGRFNVPLQKRKDTGLYDQIVLEAIALLSISKILAPNYTEESDGFYDDYRKAVEGINSGRLRLWQEITAAEIGFGPPHADSGNATENIEIELYPNTNFAGLYHTLYVIEVDGAGDIYDPDEETGATVKISIDGGKTWKQETEPAKDTWISPGGCLGLGFRFFRRGSSGNLALGDKWTIEAWPADSRVTPAAGSIRQGRVVL